MDVAEVYLWGTRIGAVVQDGIKRQPINTLVGIFTEFFSGNNADVCGLQ